MSNLGEGSGAVSSGVERFRGVEASLANGGTIDSGWLDTNGWSKYQLMFHGSASLSLVLESRPTNSGAATLSTPATYSGTFYLADLVPRQRFMRFILTNDTGSTVTGAVMSVKVITGGVEGASVFPIEIPPSQFSPAVLTQSVLIGKDFGGNTYQNAQINQAGALLVDEFSREIARGAASGYELWNKFGYNDDVDSAASETIWAQGGIFQCLTSGETLEIVSTSANDASAGTGVQSVVIYGVDENWTSQIETVTMNGTTNVTTVNSWLGVNRIAVFLSGSGQTNAGAITATATTAGTVQAIMPVGDAVTQQCVFFTPADTNFVAEFLWINCLKLGGGGAPRITVKMYVYSAINNTKQLVFSGKMDTDVQNVLNINPNLPFPISEKTCTTIEIETDQNDTIVTGRFSGILIQDET
jgi:hypothetical protein